MLEKQQKSYSKINFKSHAWMILANILYLTLRMYVYQAWYGKN